MLTSMDVKFIFDSACLSEIKGCSVLQIFSKQQMSSVQFSFYSSCCVFSQKFTYFFLMKQVKRSTILYHYQNNLNSSPGFLG